MGIQTDPRLAFAEAGSPVPMGMLCELTHRCPLQCPYCSNPLELERKSAELDVEAWCRVFRQAAALGVLQVHLSGGEPAARRDLEQIVEGCRDAGLYANLITAGVNIDRARLERLEAAGLDHVQLSFQGADAETTALVSHMKDAHSRKRAFAREVVDLGLPLTINAVIHRANIEQIDDFIALALEFGARRIEIAHAQYYGWALANRAALMPTRAQTERAIGRVEAARARLKGRLTIDSVIPDYHARYPKACMNGWGRQSINVTPGGKVLPCHAAETIPGLEFWNVAEHSLGDIWRDSPAFAAYRGTSWMNERCRSCDRREIDWGGCRCQALALTGDASETDPVCQLSPYHQRVHQLAQEESVRIVEGFRYRRPS
ncbi:pyrroloquinoline quinone biosynthesis protein PqqE [Halotalea alkalilenta]|uniref:PqqA peptide cyclase n=1 Tax=Halotalea alkalilenta TaxID=376489 RepID=A0A172YHZ5_9GAMM|nr:pyrroloquinoline quinone biosynthesis protein PqqE [Halotalea alkalilenta]ANF58813.1 pyrroloquinoline quinone biosynthesis protein PqqE [Halotalea alkalilenta]